MILKSFFILLILEGISILNWIFMKTKFKAFTLVETIIVLVAFSIIITTMLAGISAYKRFLWSSRAGVMTTNITREWVELMYHIRDTNREKYEFDKDKQIFYASGVSNFSTGYYRLTTKINAFNQKEIIAQKINVWFDDVYNQFAKHYELNKNLTNQFKLSVASGDFSTGEQEIFRDGDFYRIVKIEGIFCKNMEASCSVYDPRELEFCVKTFFVAHQGSINETEICSVLTNFLK